MSENPASENDNIKDDHDINDLLREKYGDSTGSRQGRDNISGHMGVAVARASVEAQQTTETIRDVARRIRGGCIRMREFVSTVRQSGALEELADSIREASLATRDTAREINEVARTIRERGAIRETAIAIDETAKAAQETAETVRVTAREIGEAAPVTSETRKRQEASKVTKINQHFHNN